VARAALLKLEETDSYNFDYRPIFAVLKNGPISLKKLVGAIGFEPTTPCAQGGFRAFFQLPYFQRLTIQWLTVSLLKFVEPRGA